MFTCQTDPSTAIINIHRIRQADMSSYRCCTQRHVDVIHTHIFAKCKGAIDSTTALIPHLANWLGSCEMHKRMFGSNKNYFHVYF